MAKFRHTPPRPQMAQRVIALALLASFSACSHGGEPRHSLAKEEQLSARAATSAKGTARHQSTERSKHGVIHSAEAVPEPETAQAISGTKPSEDDAAVPAADASPRAAANRGENVSTQADAVLPNPRLIEGLPVQAPAPTTADAATPAPVARPSAPSAGQPAAQPQSGAEQHETAYWPIYLGAGIAALSILALALLRHRDRNASQRKRDAELARVEAQEHAAAAAREEVQRLEQQRAAQAAAEAAAAEEAAERAAAQERAQAEVAAARVGEQSKADPRIEAAHRLFDLLHRAERDVEPFLRLLDEAAPHDATTNTSRQVVASWHESVLSTRNRLSEALARHNAPVDMRVVEPAPDLPGAMSRLIDHAARMSALMVAQQQESSAILHWSRQLPGALIQLFWRAQTVRYTSTLPQLPKVPDAPAPGAAAPVAPARAPAARPAQIRDKAVQQALRGGKGHVVGT